MPIEPKWQKEAMLSNLRWLCLSMVFLLLSVKAHGVILDTTPPWTPEMQKQAEMGNVEAQRLLGLAYELGSGIDPNGAEAEKWFRRAGAKTEIGKMYKYGQVVKENYAEAIKWFREAATEGDARAEIELGIMYGGGQGVTADAALAEQWFQKAAEDGDADIKDEIGMRYKDGWGVRKDCKEAMKWLFKAADEDSPAALLTISETYQNHGCMKDDVQEAYYWRSLWYSLLDKEPDENVAYSALTAKQKGAIKERVKVWIRAHPSMVKKAHKIYPAAFVQHPVSSGIVAPKK